MHAPEPIGRASDALAPLAAQPDPESSYEFNALAGAGVALPRDMPAWARDAVVLSERFRAVVAGLRPAVVRVLRYWDQRVRRLLLADGRAVVVDDSGCYRIE
jgi:hypothetical protein